MVNRGPVESPRLLAKVLPTKKNSKRKKHLRKREREVFRKTMITKKIAGGKENDKQLFNIE